MSKLSDNVKIKHISLTAQSFLDDFEKFLIRRDNLISQNIRVTLNELQIFLIDRWKIKDEYIKSSGQLSREENGGKLK